MLGPRIVLLFLMAVACQGLVQDSCSKGTKSTCSKIGGVCIKPSQKCNGSSKKGSKYCKNKNCQCCIEEPTTAAPTTTPVPTTTTPVPTTTTPIPTTTTPVPTTTTPLPTTTTALPSTTFDSDFSSDYSTYWPTGTDGTYAPPGPGPQRLGCYNPVDGSEHPIGDEVKGPCDTYVCTYFGWILLYKHEPTCCVIMTADHMPISYTSDIIISIGNGQIVCIDGEWQTIGGPTGGYSTGGWSYGSSGSTGEWGSTGDWGSTSTPVIVGWNGETHGQLQDKSPDDQLLTSSVQTVSSIAKLESHLKSSDIAWS